MKAPQFTEMRLRARRRDRSWIAQMSRFLSEDVRATCRLESYGGPGYEEDPHEGSQDIVGRVRAQINAMWE